MLEALAGAIFLAKAVTAQGAAIAPEAPNPNRVRSVADIQRKRERPEGFRPRPASEVWGGTGPSR